MGKQFYPIIAGPTASGKTALSIQLAKAIGGEVVSADSMQIYGGVAVGTARPTEEEMEGIPHHLMGFLPLDDKYSVARYQEDATAAFEAIYRRRKTPVMCGGTGLYIQSFMENRQLFEEESDPELRKRYQELADAEGNEVLLERLRLVDPETAGRLHVNDRNRIIRALEVYHTTGQTIAEQVKLSHSVPSPYTPCLFLLDFQDRQNLYDRINRRVDVMLEKGLLEEAKRVLATDPDATVTQAIGYKEFLPYFRGEISLEEAADKLRQQTRRYAKRQLSWFHRMSGVHTLWVDACGSAEELVTQAISIYETFMKGEDV
ncbi:MAG: tRNA (adenosine(37)-N6)-dimethylallyltransferase MiaA [Ruminococcaceae bacterium]|nr:tRNA (adenosine(37)-N6)-dimethylallyltransferase MiaA [Oscillospiraceae bacterium]